MAKCPRCGSELKGRFCMNCGFDAGSGADCSVPPPEKEQGADVRQKPPAVLWVLVAVAILALLVFLALLAARYLKGGVPRLGASARATIRLEPTAEAAAAPKEASVPTDTPVPAVTPAPTDAPVPATDAPVFTDAPGTPAPRTPAPAPVANGPNALLPTDQMLSLAAVGEINRDNVNLYSGSSSDAPLLASGLSKGAEVTVYALDGDFYFLQVNETGQCGFVSKGLVKLLSELGSIPPGSDQPESTVRGVITSISLVLREQPQVNGQVLGKYFTGQQVYVYAHERGYFYVQVAGSVLKGYMADKYIQLDFSASSGTSASDSAAANADQPKGTVLGTVLATSLALRDAPAVTGNVLGIFAQGQQVYIYRRADDYYYVRIPGTDMEGYMSASFIYPEGTVY